MCAGKGMLVLSQRRKAPMPEKSYSSVAMAAGARFLPPEKRWLFSKTLKGVLMLKDTTYVCIKGVWLCVW